VTAKEERCGNDGAEESVESQMQAFPSFHKHLGNLAKGRRDSHIPTAPTTKADGKVENQKQVSHFPTAATIDRQNSKPTHTARWQGFASPPGRKTLKGDRLWRADFQAHLALEWTSSFRLTPYWNQFLISGSFLDWKMLWLD
jgi:hypothetical protein